GRPPGRAVSQAMHAPCATSRRSGRRFPGSRTARTAARLRCRCSRSQLGHSTKPWSIRKAKSNVQTGCLHMMKYLVLAAVLLGTTACGDTWGQRAVTGGGIGAGSGSVIGALTPLGVLPGALIGTAVGAGGGAAAAPRYQSPPPPPRAE